MKFSQARFLYQIPRDFTFKGTFSLPIKILQQNFSSAVLLTITVRQTMPSSIHCAPQVPTSACTRRRSRLQPGARLDHVGMARKQI